MPAAQPRVALVLNAGLEAPVFDVTGAKTGSVTLPKDIFGEKVNAKLVAQAVRVYLANQRRGSASTKTRSEVAGSTRKIYAQKHTGNARHGGIRAPLFVHGGIAHGPRPHDFSMTMPQKMRKAALISALSGKAQAGTIAALADLTKMTPKTKAAFAMFAKMGFGEKKNMLVVLPEDNAAVYRTLRNLEGVEVTTVARLTTYEVLAKKYALFAGGSLEKLVERMAK